jgi:hypothetical protein
MAAPGRLSPLPWKKTMVGLPGLAMRQAPVSDSPSAVSSDMRVKPGGIAAGPLGAG